MKRKLFLLFLVFLCFSQTKASSTPVRNVSKKIEMLIYKKPFSEDREVYKTEKQIIKLAKDNNELSNAYYCFADVLYKNADYSDAVLMFKKVDSLTILTGNTDDRIMANLFLANMYGKLALKQQAEERFSVAEKLIKRLNIPDALLQLQYQRSSFLEENLQWCDAIPLKKNLVIYFENKVREVKEERYRINLAITCTELAYTLLKCNNNIKEAKIYLQKYEEIFRHIPEEKNNLLSQYYIDKGIISAEENDREKAEYWFGMAYQSAVFKNLETLRLRCMEEQIQYGFLNNESKKEYFSAYFQKKNELKKHTEKIIAHEQQLFIMQEADKNRKNILFIFLISVMVLVIVILYKRKRRIRLKKHFEQIIENINREKMQSQSFLLKNNTQEEIDTNDAVSCNSETFEKRIMSEEKEEELLKKIEEFEKTEIFTDEKFTMGKFASVLESNAKYINYVLHKYKGHTFSDYLNELRIKFIVNKLIEKPEYLNYKISYLAKISGFTSHSRFTYIFKNVLNISPSEFISELNRQNKNGL